jgi:hypothetical protein
MILPKAAEKEVFLRHKDKGGWEIGLELGYDKEYKIKERKKLNIAMYNTYAKVKRNPTKWGITQEEADEVIKSVTARQHTGRYLKANRDAAIELKKTGSSINTSITSVRDKAWAVLDMKMSELMRSRKARDKTTINQLVSIAGTAFDKGQVSLLRI